MDIIIPKTKETYKEYINRILSLRVNRKDDTTYQERHHILPKTMGGTNEASNLIYLYAQEHYYAHKLLAKENPSNQGLQLAWWNMCQCNNNGKREYHITAQDYAEARKKAAKANSEIRKGMVFTDEHKKNLCGHGKTVVNIITGEVFNSAKEAGAFYNISNQHIIDCCKGKRGSAGRDVSTNRPYVWRYQGEEDKDFGFNTFIFQKRIVCVETGVVYDSRNEASRQTGVSKRTISTDCNKTSSRQSKKRLHFAFLENEMINSNK